MSRFAIASAFIGYFIAALTFVLFMTTQESVPILPAAIIGRIVGSFAVIYIGSAILPIVVWAFFRFRAEKARGPVVLWACLIAGFCYLTYIGEQSGRKEMDDIKTAQGRAEYTRGVLDSCAKSRRDNPQSPNALMHTETYCRCFAEQTIQRLTGPELRFFSEGKEPPPQVVTKIKEARDTCVQAAIRARKGSP